jgi:putative DNA primase/helicase
MLNLAKSDARFTLAVGDLDRDPWLFGVANGVVDLRTGELRAAARDDYVTRRSPVRFTPSAAAPRWVQFIDEITAKPGQPRPALADYLHRALGYSLTGQTAEHKMFLAIGKGSNGKNVLLDLVQWVLGDYCQTIPPEALMATRHEGDAERPSPVAATLAGARAAISSESKEGARLDVALVKRHTGGGFMTARYMRENSFRFEITHKLWLMTNNRPALDHMDEAMRGRLHLIPFDMRWNRPGHPERDPQLPDGDKHLPEKLKAEAEGVLAWLVAGAVAYAREGLEPPAEVVQMTRAYFLELDPLGRWLEGYTVDADRGLLASELWTDFTNWQDAEDEEGGPATQTAFGLALAARGIGKKRGKDGQRYLLKVAGEG